MVVFYHLNNLGSIGFGKAADKHGRKTVLLISMTALLVSAIFCALATNKWQFLVGRTITGICIGANFGAVVSFATEVHFASWITF